MRECRTSGSVRGVLSNGHPYRNQAGGASLLQVLRHQAGVDQLVAQIVGQGARVALILHDVRRDQDEQFGAGAIFRYPYLPSAVCPPKVRHHGRISAAFTAPMIPDPSFSPPST